MLIRKLIYIVMFLPLLATGIALADGDPTRGEELTVECADCHGEDGMGDDEYPRIAGLDKDYLYEQLVKIKNGERSEEAEMMLWFFEDLEEQDLADLAAYYASQEAGQGQ